MKFTKYLFLLLTCLFISACTDDEEDDNDNGIERPEILTWIEDTMREHYYWYDEIPNTKKLDYTLNEESFFNSLLTTKDGKIINGEHYPYSYMENASGSLKSTIQENYSYGIEFTGVYIGDSEIAALILYVVPDSPADEAGLTRGDWIIKIDDNFITTNQMYASLVGSVARKLYVARWDPNAISSSGERTGNWVNRRENVQLGAARAVVDNPVHTYKKIERGGKKIGYLLYNHFTPGINDEDESFDNELRNISSEKFSGVDEFVLDLRYNNGGALSSALLLCAVLMPETALGQRLGYLKYNNKQSYPNRYFEATSNLLNPGGKNLNLKRLYILTSSSTASSSEVMINSLSPFMDVILVGDQTVGKNVGSVAYTSDNKEWIMHPIVCQVSNSLGFTDYSDGFVPGRYNANGLVETGNTIDEAFDYEIINGIEYASLTETFPLGDENERLLKAALNMIDGTSLLSKETRSPEVKTFRKAPFKSIDRKASKAVVIDLN